MNTHYRRRKVVEWANWLLMLSCVSITVFFLVAILGYVVVKGATHINWEFLTSLPVPAGETGGGIANALIGSLIVVGVASLMAIPIGIGAAIFINEFPSHGLGRTVRFLAEVLTGVPSIVVGLFAYALVVRPWGGFSAFAGSVSYGFIMIPVILISAHEALRLVPDSMREAALALGVPKWRTILGVVLPVSSSALITGVVLAVSRALGEAAPMLFTAFGNPFWNVNITKPVATVPLLIYTYATGPYEDWHQKAWAASFVLLVVVLVTSVMTRAFLRGKTHE
ncbi:MAG TPA: phosphate ABC transporter permease PstA [Candidatus Binatia bacterium]